MLLSRKLFKSNLPGRCIKIGGFVTGNAGQEYGASEIPGGIIWNSIPNNSAFIGKFGYDYKSGSKIIGATCP
jgi:hypothetical protein